MKLTMAITDEEFSAMAWIAQVEVMRGLKELSKAHERSMYGETPESCRVYALREAELRKIHATQRSELANAANRRIQIQQVTA